MNRILLIEDDSALAMGIEFALRRENFEVETVDTLKKGYEAFESRLFDLVLLDVMLPDGSGYDFCGDIRRKSSIPVIFLTACDEEVNVVMGLDIGGDDYITKPFRVKELISRIRAAIRRAPDSSRRSGHIKSRDIVLYPMEARVTKGGEEISLTPAEYKLLGILMQNPKNILTRDVILQRLWDVDGEFVDDNTLSVYIRRLREKLEDDPSKPAYIITQRGVGYKWNMDCEA